MPVVIVHPQTGESVTMVLAGKYRATGVTTQDPAKSVRGWLVPQNPDSDDDGDIDHPEIVGTGGAISNGFWDLDFEGIVSGQVYHLLVTDEDNTRDMEGEITFANLVENMPQRRSRPKAESK